ncbi:HNH endonuclease [Sulfurimonas sp. SWIR-19]|uniref:HNH endonuclease n=1 Tax=Sulfurimonas sp. SWIR-19 TaxID=2878390 RepID=UPI001CF5067A|nr:HNH endonuclease signature motif containing protein [Sulfurimonas sp. SWIR-19]UCM99275.1 HNH endonuclease [Sulfurimonas sp. SWIR-19]
MTKNEAITKINLFDTSKKLTSKNTHWSNIVSYKSENGWWLNVPFEKFKNDLYLVLNQPNQEFLILIDILANSIENPENTFRNKDETADIFIPLNSNIFIDTQSNGTKYKFSNYQIIPYFEIKDSEIIEQTKLENNFEQNIQKSKNDSQEKRLMRLKKSNKKPSSVEVKSIQYKRNPDVVVEVLNRANGICEKCKIKAPFFRKKDNTPYLEVHHIVTLANAGDDTVENAIAVCPNCHRELHFG